MEKKSSDTEAPKDPSNLEKSEVVHDVDKKAEDSIETNRDIGDLDEVSPWEALQDESPESGQDRTSSGYEFYNQLEAFRQQWQDELQQRPVSRGQSPRNIGAGQSNNPINKAELAADLENEARAHFMQGMQAEDDGMLSEAIFYYRKALQLVPDIESKLGNVFNRSTREKDKEVDDTAHDVEDSDLEENLLIRLQYMTVKEDVLCQPEYEQKMTHISCLPVELLIHILHWVVSSDLDLRSLEMFSLVCRGFYVCARDERVWRKACQKVWGSNVGSTKRYHGSWRQMLINRPHLLYDGCYISKVTYVRQGEQGMDSFYRPFHLVEYYRYVRFFPDGQMLMLVSPDDPVQSLPKLRHRNSRTAGILRGGYKLSDFKVTCVLKRVKSEPISNNRYKRHRQAANPHDLDMVYSVEFEVRPAGRKPNLQLVWCSYAVTSVQRSTGEEAVNNFELNKRTFPPLIFSRVRSYVAAAIEPLQ